MRRRGEGEKRRRGEEEKGGRGEEENHPGPRGPLLGKKGCLEKGESDRGNLSLFTPHLLRLKPLFV
jgi:hypothetical protein